MEKLYELATERDYDLIVLDTPPTAHALDFLEAPDRMLDFLGNETARALLAPAPAPGALGLKLFQLGGGYVAKTLARFTGGECSRDLGEFMAGVPGHVRGVQGPRGRGARRCSRRREVGFVLVSSRRARVSVDEALVLPRAAPRRVDADRGRWWRTG